jgi:hypothetical protein
MPFGLTNTAVTFQNYIYAALHDVLDIPTMGVLARAKEWS